jgi:hypothetical protein
MADAFRRLGAAPQVQDIEHQHAQHYWNSAMRLAQLWQPQTEIGQVLCFDIAVQNTVTAAMITEILDEISHTMTEPDKNVSELCRFL